MNLYTFLQNKLTQRPVTASIGQVHAAVNNTQQQDLLKKFGVVTDDLRKALAANDLINFERSSLYTSIDRSLVHPLMSAAPSLFADVATSYNRVQNATVWVTAKSKEYQYQIEKMLDIINIEECIYDWAWTTATFGDLFVQCHGEPGIGLVSINDDAHPINLCARGNTVIKLIDGTSPTIKEMAENPEKYIGKKIWSVNPETGLLEVDEIEAAQKTRLNTTFVRVTLDNGQFVDVTPDHRFMLRDGTYREAKDLAPGTPLMPYYTKSLQNPIIYNPGAKKWVSTFKTILTKEFLEKYYVIEKLSYVEIARMIGGKHGSTVRSYLKKFNIPLRELGKGNKKEIHTTEVSTLLTKEFLIENYVNKQLSAQDIAKEVGTSHVSVLYNLRKFNIAVRDHDQAFTQLVKQKISTSKQGEKNSSWKGGISSFTSCLYSLPEYENWRTLCFVRDVHTCQECSKHQRDGAVLECHHIKSFSLLRQEFLQHYSQFSLVEDKETLVRLATTWKPFWDLDNGETLCQDCHKLTETYGGKANKYLNHKVVSVEPLLEQEDAYDLTIKNNPNFPIGPGIFIHNSRVDYNGRLIGFYDTPGGYNTMDERKLLPPWAYIHLRLLGAKRRRPAYGGADSNYSEFRTVSIMAPDVRRLTSKYGTSVLSDALPIFKRLRLAEDSILMARITRGVIRNVWKIGIDKTNSNHEAIASLIDQYVSTLKEARSLNIDLNNPMYNSKFNSMANIEDIIIPVWGDVNQVVADKIGGEVDIKWIMDVDLLTKQLSTALKVPLPLLAGYAEAANGGIGQNSLEKLDIRFARQARRIQRALIVGLTRLAQVHLSYQGINPDMEMFQIHMSETSTAEELELQEALDRGLDVTGKMLELLETVLGPDLDRRAALEYLNEKFLKLNDLDIEKIMLKGNPKAFDVDPNADAMGGGLSGGGGSGENPFAAHTPAGEEPGTETEAPSTAPQEVPVEDEEAAAAKGNPFKENLNLTVSDLRSQLPLNEAQWNNTWADVKVKIAPVVQK